MSSGSPRERAPVPRRRTTSVQRGRISAPSPRNHPHRRRTPPGSPPPRRSTPRSPIPDQLRLRSVLPLPFWVTVMLSGAGVFTGPVEEPDRWDGVFLNSTKTLVHRAVLRQGVSEGTGRTPLLKWVRARERHLLRRVVTAMRWVEVGSMTFMLLAFIAGVVLMNSGPVVPGALLVVTMLIGTLVASGLAVMLFDHLDLMAWTTPKTPNRRHASELGRHRRG